MWSWAVLCVAERAVASITLCWDAVSLDQLDDECHALAACGASEDEVACAMLTMGGCRGEAIRAVASITLCWDAVSLDQLDDECDALAACGASEDEVAYAMLTIGGCRGEAIRAVAGGAWVRHPEGPALRVTDGLLSLLLGKVAKRIEDGPDDSLRGFHEVVLLMASGDPPTVQS